MPGVDRFPVLLVAVFVVAVSLTVDVFFTVAGRLLGVFPTEAFSLPFSRTGKSSARNTGSDSPSAACDAIVLDKPLLEAKDLTS
jgi:hypothetical protein